MTYLYKAAALVLRIFPARWNNKDTQGAVLGFVAVSLLLAALWRVIPWFVGLFS